MIRFRVTAEIHFKGDLRALDLPRVSEVKPLVGLLDLPAVLDFLVEDPEFVPDTVSDCLDFQGGQGIHETGRQPPEAPVSQTRLLFLLNECIEIKF